MNVKFGVIADLHTEFIHDAPERLERFFSECEREGCDFCVELGDFCPPGEIHAHEKRKIHALIEKFHIPFYHVIGNHDVDDHKKDTVAEHLGMSGAYYSFDFGNVHFVVLDACYFSDGERRISYNEGNYRAVKGSAPIIPDAELEWLCRDLANAEYPSVVFSHQSLIESRSSISNAEALRAVFAEAPQGVMLSVCGHEHVDRLDEKDGVYYYCLNSASYYWAGSEYSHTTYGEKIEKEYRHLRSVFPYSEPLFAIVKIGGGVIEIKGREGNIVGATPQELGFKKVGLIDKVTASVKDRTIRIN